MERTGKSVPRKRMCAGFESKKMFDEFEKLKNINILELWNWVIPGTSGPGRG